MAGRMEGADGVRGLNHLGPGRKTGEVGALGAIRVLPPSVSDQIAAGEVVERPASVVKELVENSLDARAQSIQIEVRGGGKDAIRVQDDGLGMDEDDLALAVRRHATSKLRTLDDLVASPSLGFRGEALAAIAAVSQLTISSRPPNSASGFSLCLAGQGPPDLRAQALAPGTTVEVSNLFYSVPARLKHLKSDAGELSPIQQLIVQLALAYPDIRFRLTSEQRSLFESPGQGDLIEIMLAAYGRHVAEACLPLEYHSADGSVHILGVVAPPEFSRSGRQAETVVVNGRIIHNWTLRSALEQAYRPELRDGRFPFACLRVSLPGDRLDPNVHPQKLEVRIEGERQIAALIYRSVRETLAREANSEAFWKDGGDDGASPAPHIQARLDQDLDMHAREEEPKALCAPGLTSEIARLRPLGQWQHKYIVAEGDQGLYLIDQHAAHERVYFERFRKKFDEAKFSQLLLVPRSVRVSIPLDETLESHRRELERAGFDWTMLSSDTILLRALPAALQEAALSDEQLVDILEGFYQNREHAWSYTMDAAAMAACKASVKAFRPLTVDEIFELLSQLAGAEDPRSCPHGRPTLLHFSMEEVDRRFGRKG